MATSVLRHDNLPFFAVRSLLTLEELNSNQNTNKPAVNISSTHSNEIHFLPPSKDNNSTAWIIVGVVVGTIIGVFILILVVRQLISMFRHREYDSISHSASNEHKSLFENYNNGHIDINIDDYHTNGDASQTQNTADTNVSSVYTKPKRRKKSKSKERRKHTASHSQSKSTVNFVSSDEDKDEAHIARGDQRHVRQKPRSKRVVHMLDEADEEEDSADDEQEEEDDDDGDDYYDEEDDEEQGQQVVGQPAARMLPTQRSAEAGRRTRGPSTSSMGFTASDND